MSPPLRVSPKNIAFVNKIFAIQSPLELARKRRDRGLQRPPKLPSFSSFLSAPTRTFEEIGSRKASMGSRQLDFQKSFQISIQSILTAVSKEDMYAEFSMFSKAEKESLYHLLVQVSKALHQNIAEQFESKCQDSQVLTAFDKIEHLLEEQTLDTLHADPSNIEDTKERLSTLKIEEMQYLQSLLQKVEEHNSSMETQIQSLKQNQDQINALNAVEKVKSWSSLL